MLMLFCKAEASNNAADFLRTGMSARAIALGSAYTAIADHTDGVFFNPAGLAASVYKMEMASSFVNNFELVARRNIGYATRLSNFGLEHNAVLALNMSDSRIEDIPRTEWQNDRPVIVDSFSSVESNLTFSLSKSIAWNWHVGANLRRYIYEIDRYTGEGWGADLGVLHRLPQYYFGHSIVFGATLHNLLNTPITWSTGHTDSIPMRLNVGMAAYGKLFDRKYVLSTEVGSEGGSKSTLHNGVEYWVLPEMFALRCGLDDGAFTIGTGLAYEGFTVDYAQADLKELGAIQRLSLGFVF